VSDEKLTISAPGGRDGCHHCHVSTLLIAGPALRLWRGWGLAPLWSVNYTVPLPSWMGQWLVFNEINSYSKFDLLCDQASWVWNLVLPQPTMLHWEVTPPFHALVCPFADESTNSIYELLFSKVAVINYCNLVAPQSRNLFSVVVETWNQKSDVGKATITTEAPGKNPL
jgi:hypothetical protein